MKAVFERDLYKSYMVFGNNQEEEESYSLRMLENNVIDGIIKIDMRMIDGERKFYYDITGRQPVSSFFEREKMNARQIKSIMNHIFAGIEIAREYLLDENNFVLDPEFLYVEITGLQVQLCYLPGYQRNLLEQISALLEFVLDRVDYTEETAVQIAYTLYKANRAKNYSVAELKNIVKEENPTIINREQEQNLETDTIQEKIKKEDGSVIEKNMIFTEKRGTFEENREKKPEYGKYVMLAGIIMAAILCLFIAVKSKIFCNPMNGELEAGKAGLFLLVFGVIAFSSFYSLENKKQKKLKAPSKSTVSVLEEKPLEIYVEENTVLLTQKGYFLCPVNGRDYGDMELSEFPFFIGKLKKKMNGIIESETISRFHAKIEKDENQFYLVDLNSTNGTFLNGERLAIKERYPLFIGDEIKFADVAYNFTKI
ncbi:MAG: DUF6382 domain-containing protein [Acetivibrio sp.]